MEDSKQAPAVEAAQNLLAHAAATLINNAYAIDLKNPQQLLVLELSDNDFNTQNIQSLQEMMAALSSMTGLSGVIVNNQLKLVAVPICSDCPFHGHQDGRSHSSTEICTCIKPTQPTQPTGDKHE